MPPPVEMKGTRARRAMLLGTLLTLATVACCAVTLLGWGRGFVTALQGSTRIVTRAGPMDPVSLETEALRGVTVRPTDRPSVIATLLGPHPEGSLSVERRDGTVRVSLSEGAEGASLMLEMPVGAPLTIRLGSGAVTVTEMEGEFDIVVERGEITVRDHAARGSLRAQVGRGDLDIAIRSLDDDSELLLTSDTANIVLQIPDGIGFAFDGRTDAGTVTIAGVTVTPSQESTPGDGALLVGSAEPERGRRISLTARVGDILLRAR